MQRALRRRRGWRRRILGSVGLIVLFVLGWFIGPPTTPKTAETALPTKLPATDEPVTSTSAPSKSSEPVSIRAVRSLRYATAWIPKPMVITRIGREEVTPIAAHGRPTVLPTGVTEQIRPMAVGWSTEEAAIQKQMLTGDFGSDSTSYYTLTRNLRQWPDAVVVCDLTSSMYPYSTQLFAWFRQNARNSAIKGLVFFTDCDSLGQQTQPNGPAGRMFVTHERDATIVLSLLIETARNTVHNNGDAENDVEALLFAQKTFPEAKHLVLLADNMSQVKDINRLDGVTKPVHVVLCGTTGSNLTLPFQPDHYTIASRTKGSLHTIEDDLKPDEIPRHTMLRVGTHYYRYNARKSSFGSLRSRVGPFIWPDLCGYKVISDAQNRTASDSFLFVHTPKRNDPPLE